MVNKTIVRVIITFIFSFIFIFIGKSQNTFPATGNAGIGTTSPTAPLQINGSANDLITIYGSGVTRAGFYIQNTSTTGQSTIYADNNRGNFATYGGILTGSTADTYPAIFGLSRADRTFVFSDGVSSLGLGLGTLTAQPLVFGTNNTEQMRIDASGNLCMGTNIGVEKLTISGNALANKFRLNNLSTPMAGAGIFAPAASTFAVYTNSAEQLRVDASGHVGIGTTNINDPNFKLFVETGIRTRKITVDQNTWPDFVFDPAYRLLPLNELRSFINKNKRLPGVISADEVESKGVDLGANQVVLLKKIEELTLYIIEQDKRIKRLEENMKRERQHNKNYNGKIHN